MAEGTHLYFVTWPDGKVDDKSVNVFSKRHAKCWMIRSWFPADIFGEPHWLTPDAYVLGEIWNGMEKKGFKVHGIAVPAAVAAAT